MPRKARLFESAKGSPVNGFLRLKANLPPNWIERSRASRKALESEVLRSVRKMKQLRLTRPNARVTIKGAKKAMHAALRRWQTAYQKECFYYGIRVLLELERYGETKY
jgi:hypothetical protein